MGPEKRGKGREKEKEGKGDVVGASKKDRRGEIKKKERELGQKKRWGRKVRKKREERGEEKRDIKEQKREGKTTGPPLFQRLKVIRPKQSKRLCLGYFYSNPNLRNKVKISPI